MSPLGNILRSVQGYGSAHSSPTLFTRGSVAATSMSLPSPAFSTERTNESSPFTDLIESEKIYVEYLTGIIQKLTAAWSRYNPAPLELGDMFRNITTVYKANLTFLEKLEEIGSNPSSKALDDLLMRWIHDLNRPYTMYCQKLTTGFDQWEPVKSNVKLPRVLEAFSEYNPPSIAAIQSSQLANPSLWTLDALFLLPKGRLLYYRKLYNNLLSSTTLSISDRRLLTVALEKLDYLLETLEARSQVRVGNNTSALSSTLPPVTSGLARKPTNSPAKSRLTKSNGTHNKLFSDQFGEGNANTFTANANNIALFHRIRLVSLLDSLPFEPISRYLRDGDTPLRIGRFTGRQVDNALVTDKLTFKSMVVSRAHAEIWADNGKVYIKDTKSSCGTFLNYRRLSPAESESTPHELKDGDIVQLAVDYDDGTEVYKPVRFTIGVRHESQAATKHFRYAFFYPF
ncbi:hypothetical protein AZE42_10855 [Rhizopogon vesiculosus]|uniref:FHA domain-containing protein n=1 Tax=Rhizopogon vesiculosus TaxID=180088 RepID=A0A1J8QW11_9AGAM|nr:hypothetical protein AZE42_10855 [Rhizopogon vesiculosus]